jgi:hypothetical protein
MSTTTVKEKGSRFSPAAAFAGFKKKVTLELAELKKAEALEFKSFREAQQLGRKAFMKEQKQEAADFRKASKAKIEVSKKAVESNMFKLMKDFENFIKDNDSLQTKAPANTKTMMVGEFIGKPNVVAKGKIEKSVAKK